jgi:hypothetical protein
MKQMDQPEMPQEPAANPAAEPVPPPQPPSEPAPRMELPDPKGALPIPEHFRLPFRGKTETPTAVPSGTQRRFNLDRLKKRARRRGFLTGLLVGQVLIVAMDLGGELFLKTHPHVTLRAKIPVSSIVFLGMAAGAAVMLLAVAMIYGGMGLRGFFGKKPAVAATGRGIRRVFLTVLALGVTMGVILGTAWFMIPQPKWKDTVDFAKERGVDLLDASKATLRSWFRSAPRAQ